MVTHGFLHQWAIDVEYGPQNTLLELLRIFSATYRLGVNSDLALGVRLGRHGDWGRNNVDGLHIDTDYDYLRMVDSTWISMEPYELRSRCSKGRFRSVDGRGDAGAARNTQDLPI
jgi:hypothetical protein